MSATPRLYVEAGLAEGAGLRLTTQQSHYVQHVMRLGVGASVRVFNGADGEFDAEIDSVGKNAVALRLLSQSRTQSKSPDIWLLFAPLKKDATDFVVEKATELGVSELRPVLTERTMAREVRADRLRRIAIEAAEQTERLDVPLVREPVKLARAFDGWDAGRRVFHGDEAGEDGAKPWGGEAGRATPMMDVMLAEPDAVAAILIGPEGGFAPMERAWLKSLPFVRAAGLGPRILRAETAAVAALALWQAVRGDWRQV